MKYRPFHSCLTVGTLALALAACGNSTTTAPTAATAVAVAPTAAPAAPTGEPTAAPLAATSAPQAATAAPTVDAAPTAELNSKSGTEAGSSVTADGWQRFELADDGFAIALPKGWDRIDLSKGQLSAAIDEVVKRNPNLGGEFAGQMQAMASAGIKFFGFDTATIDSADNFVSNVNILKQSIGGDIPLDAIEQANVQQIKDVMKVADVQTDRVTTQAGEAIVLRYQPQMNTSASEGLKSSLTQYIFLQNGDLYVISMTSLPKLEDSYASTFEKIAQSFEILK